MSKKNTITSFDDLVQAWTDRMMELDHTVTANRRSIDGLEKQIDETYQEMEDIQKAAYDLLGDKVQFNLYENEDNAIRIIFKSNSMHEPLVNIVKDRKIQVGKEPKQFEKSYFDTNIKSTVADEETGSWSSIEQGFIGVDEYGKPIQGLKISVGNTDSEVEPETQQYRVRVPESSVEVSPDEVKLKGDTITFGKDVKLARYEKEIENLKYQVKMLEEWHTPKQDPVPMEFDEENTSDKSPVLQGVVDTESFAFPSTLEEYNNLYKLTCDLVNKLDTDNLEKLNIIWSGSYMYDMKDFHSLVAQIFVIQEASKKKGGE